LHTYHILAYFMIGRVSVSVPFTNGPESTQATILSVVPFRAMSCLRTKPPFHRLRHIVQCFGTLDLSDLAFQTVEWCWLCWHLSRCGLLGELGKLGKLNYSTTLPGEVGAMYQCRLNRKLLQPSNAHTNGERERETHMLVYVNIILCIKYIYNIYYCFLFIIWYN
jgi:hypothetical protein